MICPMIDFIFSLSSYNSTARVNGIGDIPNRRVIETDAITIWFTEVDHRVFQPTGAPNDRKWYRSEGHTSG